MDGSRIKSLFTRDKKKEELKPVEKAKAEEIVESLTKKVEDNYSLEEVDKAEKAAEKYKGKKQLAAIWSKIQVLFLIARHPTVWGPGVAVPACVAVLYLVLPIDAIPDAIPLAGLIDDIFVITTLVGVLVKKISSYTKEKISLLRKEVPEDLLSTFDEMFSYAKDYEENIEVMEEEPSIITGLGKAKDAIDGFRLDLEKQAVTNPEIKNRKFFKTLDRVSEFASSIPSKASRVAAEALKAALSFIILKKEIKSLISFSFFALSLLFLYLSTTLGTFTLVLSSLFMILSYSFLIHSIIKAVPRVIAFFEGLVKGGLEDGICSFILKECSYTPSGKEILLKYGIRELKRNKEAVKEMLYSFRKQLLFFILHIALITLAFFLLKKVSLVAMGETSAFKIIFAPIFKLFGYGS
ncbi:MAG: DUF1232 domain-containing protein [Spirochaetales bacterium]|nr:DUF1232 domain-containing protein [Spirochaetales bacterium]MDD6842035.1 DUF1232 domain-containing protein [Spirochaetales bacterium]